MISGRRMKDDELRGAILQRFYDYRHKLSIIQLPDLASVCPGEPLRVANICDQLAANGLVEWRTSKSVGAIGGIGKISAAGIDVIDGNRPAPMTIVLKHGRGASRLSTTTSIDDANLSNAQFDLGTILEAIDNARALDVEKLAAKSLIGRLNANPLAWSVVKSLAEAHG
jgi:hypothetical protein